jgi:5'-3' exonuclease
MRLLIDLDIILYRGLWACKDQGFFAGIRACNSITENIISRFNYEYELIMSGFGNFRKQISSEYKANRKSESRPLYLWDTKQWFKKYWDAVEVNGMEADDYIGINHNDNTIIVSTDKDYNQLGGKRYNWVKDEMIEIDNPNYYFWYQMVVGDSSDNVKTLHGYGPKKAEKLLSGKSDDEMKIVVQDLYKYYYKDDWFSRFDTTARLLFIRRTYTSEYYNYF